METELVCNGYKCSIPPSYILRVDGKVYYYCKKHYYQDKEFLENEKQDER